VIGHTYAMQCFQHRYFASICCIVFVKQHKLANKLLLWTCSF